MNKLSPESVISIIPVYKDGNDLLEVLSKFRSGTTNEICVILDCVPEIYITKIETIQKQIGIPIYIFINKKREGIGKAIQKGIQYANSRKYEVIVIMAGNKKDNPQEIPRLINPILQEGYDYVQGSRFLSGGKPYRTPLLRKIFCFLYPFIWTMFTGVRCTDVTNGFRAYKLNILKNPRININQSWLKSYQLEYYLHYKALTLGYKTKEVPVSKTYSYRKKGGYTKISIFRDSWSIFSPLIYLALKIRD